MGRRVNTREQRTKDKLMAERQRLVERAKYLNPSYRPPLDYRPFNTKKIRKVYVPVKEYPDYNFIGLILGPRGMTQRQMEQDTGAKISLRGKGSVRDGKGRSATKDNNEDEDLHVVISGDSEDSLDHAEALVRRLLVPVEEGKNDIKRKQLRKLAEMNGTLRDSSYGFEKEERAKRGGGGEMMEGGIYCKWCGETSHPSSDCTQRGRVNMSSSSTTTTSSFAGAGRPKVVTQEYFDLMQTLGEDVSGMVVQGSSSSSTSDVENSNKDEGFNAFLASVGVQSSDQHRDHHGGSRGGRFSSSSSSHTQFGQQQQQQQQQQLGSSEIPPWERMDVNSSSGGAGSGAPPSVAPWDL